MNQDLSVFIELKSSITSFVAPTKAIKVTDFASSQIAIEAAKQLRAYKNQVEDKRKEITDPLNVRIKGLIAYAKEITEPLLEAEKALTNQLIAFEEAQRVIRAAEQAKLDAERARIESEARAKEEAALAEVEVSSEQAASAESIWGVDEAEIAEIQAQKETVVAQIEIDRAVRAAEHKAKTWDVNQNRISGARQTWKCELIDINLVPAAFVIRELNTQAVLAAARGGATDIPGVRLYQETGISLGRNTRVPMAALGK
jgi:hypothetical protein